MNRNEFKLDCVDMTENGIEAVDTKVVYNCDNVITASEWVKSSVKGTLEFPSFSSALKLCTRKGIKANAGMLGCLCSFANNVDKNGQMVAMFSGVGNIGNGGTYIMNTDNFTRCTALFSARRLVECNWQNWADEYLAPNTEDERYAEFENDSIVYSLFESKSNQSSLRQVEYKDKNWDIKNEFFWMSRDEIMQLANEAINTDCYNDAATDTDRFVYNRLKDTQLSSEAQAVLDKASEIVRLTFKYRKEYDFDKPEYQFNNWDCGWYQIKELAKRYCEIEYKEFVALYKALGDKMRPMVKELGFLK